MLSTVVAIQMMCFFLSKRQIDLFGLTVNGSGILFPIDVYLFEIIGYCYGYEYSRQAVWTNIAIHILFFVLSITIRALPYAPQMHTNLINAYDVIFKFSHWMIIGSVLGEVVGDFFSAIVVPRSKLHFHGKYSSLIIFLVHIIASFLVISISYLIINLPEGYSLIEICRLIMGTMVIKIIIAVIMLPIARIVIYQIKCAEGLDIFDSHNQSYSLFKFNTDYSKLKFVKYRGQYDIKKNFNAK